MFLLINRCIFILPLLSWCWIILLNGSSNVYNWVVGNEYAHNLSALIVSFALLSGYIQVASILHCAFSRASGKWFRLFLVFIFPIVGATIYFYKYIAKFGVVVEEASNYKHSLNIRKKTEGRLGRLRYVFALAVFYGISLGLVWLVIFNLLPLFVSEEATFFAVAMASIFLGIGFFAYMVYLSYVYGKEGRYGILELNKVVFKEIVRKIV